MAFIQCECGERINLNPAASQVTCEECGRTYTAPKLESPVRSVKSQRTPTPSAHATPLSATMVEDLPAMTQVENPFGDSIVAIAQDAAPTAGLAAIAPMASNDSGDVQNLFSTPAGQPTPAEQHQIDTTSNGGYATELGPGLRLLDRYEIQRKIGQGGMSTVYEAFDSVRGEKVALKVLLPNLAAHPALQERFLQEGRLSSNFSHPNIARVYDLHQTESLIFLSMELLHGTTLRHDMNRRNDQRQVYRPTEVMDILDDVCDALEVVHDEGVVHRDLKPENLWLGLDGSAKVMDFGIARDSTGTSFTNVGRGSGTPYYIAPEQLAASPTMDNRADQYSVGIILYELLTGELPQGAIVPPHEKNPAIPRKMSEAIFRALDSEPANRFDSISEFREAAKFRTEKTLLGIILKPLAMVSLLGLAGFAFVRWGAPLLEKKESPVWEPLGTQRVVENEELRFTTRSALCTIDSNALTFKLLSDAPVGATLDPKTGEFVWTPTEAQGPKEYQFTIMAVAEEEGRAPVVRERSFTVNVAENVDKPIFALPEPVRGKEHEVLTYQITASDPNFPAVGLRYELPKLLPGMTVDHRSGEIKWTPNEQQGGENYQLAVRVYLEGEDHLEDFTERTLNVQIEESIDPPVITVPEQFKGTIGESSNLRATVRDPNVPAIDDYFALKGGERIGMTIDPLSGEIFWSPSADQAGKEQEVTVQVLWDGAGKTSVLSERVVQVSVDTGDEELADGREDGSLAGGDNPLNDSPLAGGGLADGGFGGGLGGGGVGGADCDENCEKPNGSLPGTGHSSAPVFGSPFPTNIGGNRPSGGGGGGGRPNGGGGGNTGGGRGSNFGQVIDLIQKIKEKKQQGSSSAANGVQPKPSFPTNKLPPGWRNKLPTQGIRLQDLNKKGQSNKKASTRTRLTRDLPTSSLNRSKLPLQLNSKQRDSNQRSSTQPATSQRDSVQWNKKLPSSLQSRGQQRTSNRAKNYGLQTRQNSSVRQVQSTTRQSPTRQNSTRSRSSNVRSSGNGGNNKSRQSSQWDKLKNASSRWKKR